MSLEENILLFLLPCCIRSYWFVWGLSGLPLGITHASLPPCTVKVSATNVAITHHHFNKPVEMLDVPGTLTNRAGVFHWDKFIRGCNCQAIRRYNFVSYSIVQIKQTSFSYSRDWSRIASTQEFAASLGNISRLSQKQKWKAYKIYYLELPHEKGHNETDIKQECKKALWHKPDQLCR